MQNVLSENIGLGPKMAFILRVYNMSEAENTEDKERDREMVKAGVMSEREFRKPIPSSPSTSEAAGHDLVVVMFGRGLTTPRLRRSKYIGTRDTP